MQTLAALALATPIWGFALQPPLAAAPDLLPPLAAEVRASAADRPLEAERERWRESHNAAMMNWTRAFQASTAAMMMATAVFGAIQFRDEYGFHGRYAETPCGGQGTPVFDYCGRSTPWPHLLVAGGAASALLSTFGVSTAIDFERAARRSPNWRTFQVTRFVALGLAALQALGGALLANSVRAGWLDEVQDFDTLQGLAVAHMALGVVNVAVNVANTVLLF